ncbi:MULTISPECIES: CcoQ/FixQ family Cbb3-type cytochrome c oxidase assembly chaperone [Pseudacidovorax]|jgi:cytochrome c oxidase cbb3-type subunit IV|uniref:Cytochrome c oxidase cbb3-type subunit 4 n=1 Tax=Pseudacidovorax intermedius TaxID=433924 RepID=A0A370FAA9_9BURK|nr:MULTISPECIES: CcoQ/FixQ family Cbb3-type cytochrome c oxidase assembly chaperone [Pseudacidovorax]MBO9644047.1 CcoQ/FixQ family Cbb3-type cytochrome c oxidase assembly chaperone [Pseudacidovorax sp.]MBP6896882.1 CcoQ/FixQ family Cbb3-type cytochrome c oxidase assembly chaperone [Pseudacidovorax sp.]RDI21250.1 cytochrome c oxidase cbb3-type subunit 4 [Pseudacidovorax intermedius]SIP97222.1 cytochrome c oxidase cbb3-type subunit 4 [Pseudacidovorax sp. RU35E]
MDLTTLRSIATVVCFVLFLGIVAWAYARRNRAGFEEAARLPFEQD